MRTDKVWQTKMLPKTSLHPMNELVNLKNTKRILSNAIFANPAGKSHRCGCVWNADPASTSPAFNKKEKPPHAISAKSAGSINKKRCAKLK